MVPLVRKSSFRVPPGRVLRNPKLMLHHDWCKALSRAPSALPSQRAGCLLFFSHNLTPNRRPIAMRNWQHTTCLRGACQKQSNIHPSFFACCAAQNVPAAICIYMIRLVLRDMAFILATPSMAWADLAAFGTFGRQHLGFHELG